MRPGRTRSLFPMDWNLFHTVNGWSRDSAWAHGFFRSFADYGTVLFGLALVVAFLIGLRGDARVMARSVWTGAAAIVALIVNQPIANIVDRARPYTLHSHVLTLVDRGKDPSFMSDHSLVAGAVAVGLLFAVRRLGYIAVALAFLMAFTRVYVGAHYPGDVAAGLIFGGGIAAAGIPLADRILVPWCERAQGTLLLSRFRNTPTND